MRTRIAALAVASALVASGLALARREPVHPAPPSSGLAAHVLIRIPQPAQAPDRPTRRDGNISPDTESSTTEVPPTATTLDAPAPPPPPGGRLVREWHVMYARAGSSADRSDGEPCPRPSTCEAHSVRAPRWPTDESGRAVIPFAYNDEGRRRVRAPDGILRPALSAATAEWMRWNSNIVFTDTGSSDAVFGADGEDGTCDDGTNVVTWHTFDPDVIGAAVLCFDETGKVIRDADLALNATQHWERVSGEPQSRHSHDIQSILTHELGHWFALADLYSADAAGQTMYGSTEYGEVHKRTLARGDAIGIQKAYPCAGSDRCPRDGFADD